MRAMLIKGTLEEYELVTSKEIPHGLVTSREFVRLAIRTAIPAYVCEDSEDFEEHVRRQFPIYSEETMIISKEYDNYNGLGVQLDMECEQPRYFVEIDRDIGEFGELVLTEEFGYCLLLNIQSNEWTAPHLLPGKPYRKVTTVNLINDTLNVSIGNAASEYVARVQSIIDSKPWRSTNELYEGEFYVPSSE